MTPSDELFQLIKSLTPSEKRYFKVHASRHVIGNSNHYEKLFDALDALPDDQDYDEAAFKKSLRGKSYGKNLSDEKTHLREILLRAMRLYHAERTPKGRLVEMIHEINFLYSKGFVRNCHQQIMKAIKLATETEQLTEMLVLNDFLVRLYRLDPVLAPYTAAEMEHRERAILDRIVLTREAIYLRMQMTEIQSSRQWVEREAEAKAYADRASALSSREDVSTRASILLLNARQRYLIHHRDYPESLRITIEWIERTQPDTRDMESLTDDYRVVLANYMMCAMHCERFELLPDAIAKLKALRTNYEKEEADSFRLSTQYELIYLLNSADLSDAHNILREVEYGLKKHKRFIPADQAVTFRFNIALLNFLRKEYSECLDQIHSLYTISGREKNYDYTTTMARTMEWMCQSSIGNDQILDAGLRSLRRHLSEKNLTEDFFAELCGRFAAVMRSGNQKTTETRQPLSTQAPPGWDQLQAIFTAWL